MCNKKRKEKHLKKELEGQIKNFTTKSRYYELCNIRGQYKNRQYRQRSTNFPTFVPFEYKKLQWVNNTAKIHTAPYFQPRKNQFRSVSNDIKRINSCPRT